MGVPPMFGRDGRDARATISMTHECQRPEFSIRGFRPGDLPACRKLYVEGLLGGKLSENDTGLDIDDIDAVYMHTPGNHFWVAENRAAR